MNILPFGERNGFGGATALPHSHASHLLGRGDVDVSFEFLPPHATDAETKLWQHIKRLAPFNPTHLTITSGGDRATQQRTLSLLFRAQQEFDLTIVPHITCRHSDVSKIDAVLEEYWNAGIREIVAIRGDSFNDGKRGPPNAGYADVASLIRAIRRVAPYKIIVAAYPEKHPLALDMASDLDALKRKIDVGATSAITQYFFNNDHFFRFLDRVRSAGITIPITPGLLPIYSLSQVTQISARCSIDVPPKLVARLSDLAHDNVTCRYEAAAFTAEQIIDLVRGGISNIHFFTLNRADFVYGICHLVGLRASGVRQ
jgi:methylenetetrahydrofolate reductase (NADPH)